MANIVLFVAKKRGYQMNKHGFSIVGGYIVWAGNVLHREDLLIEYQQVIGANDAENGDFLALYNGHNTDDFEPIYRYKIDEFDILPKNLNGDDGLNFIFKRALNLRRGARPVDMLL